MIPSYIFKEFRKSAIPDRLTSANVYYVDGDEAIEILAEEAVRQVQRVTEYVTMPARRILDRYGFAYEGGWIAYGTTLDGEDGEIAYFKPRKPRKDLKNGKLKPVKYETPAKRQALPILPWVDDQTAQEIYKRYDVTPMEGETFWHCVWRCALPIAITEGLKKALSLIAHGIPAIAVRGITQWHVKGSRELHSEIADFASLGRKIYIVFDEDSKKSTRRDVDRETKNLGTELEKCGCTVHVVVWDGKEGKGIDDLLYTKGETAQAHLDKLIESAPTLKAYKRHGRRAAAIEIIDRLNRLNYPIERDTEGEYLPELPDLKQGAIHILTADMNAGKTTRIGQDWVALAIAMGWNVLVLSPLNSLGGQTAEDWNLPHIHDYANDRFSQTALWSDVSYRHGLVCCPDSLHRMPDEFWQRPVLLILDEANQVIEHMAQGDTLGSRYGDIWERFSAAANHAISTGAIVLSEAGLPDRAIKLVGDISGCDQVRVFRHKKQATPWDCNVYSGQVSGFRAKVLGRVSQGKRILYAASSQREAKRMERAIAKRSPDVNVVRVDSETNEGGNFRGFFQNPDQWLQENQPDILILSPSAKSGVSIEGGVSAVDAYFSEVWGYFPALATDTHMQQLGRYRPPVPRFLFVPPFIMASGDEALTYPRAIKRRLEANLKGLAGVFELSNLVSGDDRAEQLVTIENAVLDYLVESKSVSGAQKSISHDALVNALESAGHTVKLLESSKEKEVSDLWKQIQEEIWREEAGELASATLDHTHSTTWARKQLDSIDVSRQNRIKAYKVLWRDEFPGVAFDDAEECYRCLVEDWGAMRRGVSLQAHAEHLEVVRASDSAEAQKILSSKVRAAHRLPKRYARALLINQLSILPMLDGQSWSNADPRAIAVKKAALQWRSEIYYWLRLTIKPDQTPSEIVNKLIRKLGLKAEAIGRPGSRTESRDRVWTIENSEDPYRNKLLKALRSKLSSSVSTICNRQNTTIQTVDTASSKQAGPPPDRGLAVVAEMKRCKSWSDFLELGQRYAHEIKQKAWDWLLENDKDAALRISQLKREAIAA